MVNPFVTSYTFFFTYCFQLQTRLNKVMKEMMEFVVSVPDLPGNLHCRLDNRYMYDQKYYSSLRLGFLHPYSRDCSPSCSAQFRSRHRRLLLFKRTPDSYNQSDGKESVIHASETKISRRDMQNTDTSVR